MASLYEINEKLEAAIEFGCDPETGEFIDENGLNDLYMELNDKIEGVALYQKNLESEAEAIDKEIQSLKERKERKKKRAESMKKYLSSYLLAKDMKKFETPKVAIKFRKSTVVEIVDEKMLPEQFVNTVVKTESKPDKKAIKDYLKKHSDEVIDGAMLVEKQNISIS